MSTTASTRPHTGTRTGIRTGSQTGTQTGTQTATQTDRHPTRSGHDRGPARRTRSAPAVRSSQPADAAASRRERTCLELGVLFDSRDDLHGISIVADVLAETVLWSA